MKFLFIAVFLFVASHTSAQVCDTFYTTVYYDSAYILRIRCKDNIVHKHTDSIKQVVVCSFHTRFGAFVSGGSTTLSQDLHNAKQYIPLPGSFYRDRLFMDGPGATGISANYNKITDSGYKISMIIKWGNSSNINPVAFPTDMVDYAAKLRASLSHFDTTVTGDLDTSIVGPILIEDEETTANHTGYINSYLTECTTAAAIIHGKNGKVTNGGIHPAGIGLVMYYDYFARGHADSAILLRDRTFSLQMKNYVANPASNPNMDAYRKKCDTLLHGYAAAGLDYVNLHWKEPFNGIGTGAHMIPGGYKEYFDFVKRITGLPLMSNEVGFNTSAGSTTALLEMMNEFVNNGFVWVLWFDDNDEGPGQGLMNNGVLTANGTAYKGFIINYNSF